MTKQEFLEIRGLLREVLLKLNISYALHDNKSLNEKWEGYLFFGEDGTPGPIFLSHERHLADQHSMDTGRNYISVIEK